MLSTVLGTFVGLHLRGHQKLPRLPRDSCQTQTAECVCDDDACLTPLTAQKRSGFWQGLAVMISPFGATTDNSRMLSTAMPCREPTGLCPPPVRKPPRPTLGSAAPTMIMLCSAAICCISPMTWPAAAVMAVYCVGSDGHAENLSW